MIKLESDPCISTRISHHHTLTMMGNYLICTPDLTLTAQEPHQEKDGSYMSLWMGLWLEAGEDAYCITWFKAVFTHQVHCFYLDSAFIQGGFERDWMKIMGVGGILKSPRLSLCAPLYKRNLQQKSIHHCPAEEGSRMLSIPNITEAHKNREATGPTQVVRHL